MANTPENVLVGVAVLEVSAPDGQRAEWSDEQAETGSYSIKLSKPATGDYGSTHVQFTPLAAALAKKISDLEGASGTDWAWKKFRQAVSGAYWEQLELRFEDPNTTAWVDITIQVDVAELGAAEWQQEVLAHATSMCMFGGWSEGAGSFSRWTLDVLTDVSGDIETAENAAGGTISNADDWTLTRCRVELWETAVKRYVYIDDIYLGGTLHTLEPGNTTPGLRLSSNFTEVGYTEDGVSVSYTPTSEDIKVEEETFPIGSALTEEAWEVTCNMAESSLFNIDKAIAGSVLSGSILKIGAGVNKKISLQIRGTDPAGYIRAIQLASCVATGTVAMSYRKGEKTIVPVTFRALKTANHPAVVMVDNAA